MPRKSTAVFAGIHNENEFYSHHYLAEIFRGDLRTTLDRWRTEAANAEHGTRTPWVASVAVLFGADGSDLLEMAYAGSPAHRRGIAFVAKDVVKFPEHRDWAEAQLERLFEDSDEEVQRIAADCFRHLRGSPLGDYEQLIAKFCSSAAFSGYARDLLRALDESSHQLPGMILSVLDTLLQTRDAEAWDVQFEVDPNIGLVVKLVLRIYNRHPDTEWSAKCLDPFDKMSVSGMPYVRKALEDYER